MSNNNANNNLNSMRCWICMDFIIDYMLLPYEDEYLGHDVGIFKNTMIIKDFNDFGSNIPAFSFLYFTCCNKCIDSYLKIHNNKFKYIRKRELTGGK